MKTNLKLADAYYRLSVEEANGGESSSITNQRSIVRQYCEDNGITIVKEFVDDGFSGSNFDRPGFSQMIAHLKDGLANMVITKDLSRLGRDMTESSYYAETYFPENQIHYIAISDNFDSNEVNIMAPFQFAMNDVYLRDTSRKIKQVINQKRTKGEYCACPPFGYMKNKDGTALEPDPKTAPIVQKIFAMAHDGKSARAIATALTENGDITPLKYRVLYRDNFGERGAARAVDEWNYTTVKRILKNPVYLGHTILGKTKKASLKSKKKLAVPEENWFITENTHTPLVTKEQFDQAAYFMGMNTKNWQSYEKCRSSIFNGLTFCAHCGGAMCSSGTVYKGERMKYWYLSCNNIPKRSKNHCEHGARIKYTDLLEIIKADLNQLISLSDKDKKEIIKQAIQRSEQVNIYENSEDNKSAIEGRIETIDRIIMKLYNDYAAGTISEDVLNTTASKMSDEVAKLKKQLSEIERKQSNGNEITNNYEKFFALVKQYEHIDELTEEIVRTFIEKIEIEEKVLPENKKIAGKNVPYKQKITIYYRFIGLNTGIIGTLMLVSKFLDGISDVIFGNLIDRTKSKLGKARPWMLYAQIGVSLCLVLLFSIPGGMSETAQYAYFFAFYTALNAIFYTANGIAYSALSALITRNKNERVQLGSIRFMFAVVTNIVMGFAVTGAVDAFGGGASGWRMVAVICGVIVLVVNTISCLCVKELPEEDSVAVEDTQKPKDDKIGFVESLKLLISNKYYILIVAIYIVYYFMSNLTTGSAIYFMKHVLGNGSLLGLFSMMKMFPVIIALIFTPILVKKTGSMQKVNFWGYVISDILGIFLIIFAMQKNLPMMLLFMFLKGTFAGTMSGTLNALIAEISGYTYRTKGVHIDGMMFSCSSLGVKVGGGIGTAAVGWLLHAAGYAGKAATQTAAATNMIFSMYITIPVILGVVITILLGLMKVEKENKRIDMERAEKAD